MTKVFREVCKAYGEELKTWYYPGAPEGGMGEMCYIPDHCIDIVIETKSGCPEFGFRDEYFEGDIGEHFPIHFLFRSANEVYDKVLKFVKRDKLTDTEKKKLIESASYKLTEKEKEALGI